MADPIVVTPWIKDRQHWAIGCKVYSIQCTTHSFGCSHMIPRHLNLMWYTAFFFHSLKPKGCIRSLKVLLDQGKSNHYHLCYLEANLNWLSLRFLIDEFITKLANPLQQVYTILIHIAQMSSNSPSGKDHPFPTKARLASTQLKGVIYVQSRFPPK